MAYKYNPDEYTKLFDEMLGQGAYDSGMRQAESIGRQIGQSKRYAEEMERRRKEEEKRRKERLKEQEKKKKEEAKKKLLEGLYEEEEKKKKKDGDGFSWSGVGKGIMKGLELVDRTGDSIRTGIKETFDGDKDGFLKGFKEGWSDKKFTNSGVDLNRSLGFDPSKDKKDAVIADLLGRTLTNKVPGANLISPFLSSKLKRDIGEQAVGIGTETVTDPTNLLGAGLLTKGVNKLGKAGKAVSKAVKGPVEELLGLPEPQKMLPSPAPEPIRQLALPAPRQNRVSGQMMEDSGLGFATSGRSEVKSRPLLDALNIPKKATETRPPEYWQSRYEEFANAINSRPDAKNMSEESIKELWTQFAKYDEPYSLDEVVDMAYPKGMLNKAEVPEPPVRNLQADPQFAREAVPPRPERPLMPEPPARDLQVPEQFRLESIPRPVEPTIAPRGKVEGILNGANPNPATPISRGFDTLGQARDRAQIESPISKLWNKNAKWALDKTVYVKSIENELKNIPRFKGSGEMYQKLTNVRGASAASERYVKNNLLPALDAVEEAGGGRMNALDYVYAHNLLETATANPGYQLPKGVTVDDLEQTVAMFANRPEMEAFRQSMKNYWRGLQDELVEAGWLTQDQVNAMRQMYPNYMPKFRAKDLEDPEKFEEAFSRLIGGKGTKNPVHSIESGSDEQIADPIENIIKATQNMQYAAMRNKALQHLDDLADLPMKTGHLAVKRVPRGGKASNPVKVRFNGEERVYDVHEELAEAITTVKDVLDIDPVLGMFAKAAKTQRTLVTGNLVFTVRNLLRDIPNSWVTSKAGWSFTRDLPMAALDIMTNGKMNGSVLDDFYKHGGGQSTIWSQDRNAFRDLQKQAYGSEYSKGFKTMQDFTGMKKYLGTMMDLLRKFNEATEQLPKVAEYRAGVRKGLSPEESAFNARDTMDFMKSGSSVQKINKYVAFINANIRGKDKMVRSLAEKPLPTLAKASAVGMIPSGLAFLAYKNLATDDQKQMIDEAPPWLRDTFWLFPHPNRTDIIRIPKPFDVAALFSSPLEYGIRYLEGQDTDIESEVKDWFIANMYINPSLNPVTPFIEAGFNQDSFTKGAIVPAREEDLPKGEQKDVYTSSVAEGIAGAFGKVPILDDTKAASPRVVDHILKGVFPGAGEAALDMTDALLENMGVRENQKPTGMGKGIADPLAKAATQFKIKEEGNSAFTVANKMYDMQAQLKVRKKKEGDAFLFPNVYKEINRSVKEKHEYDSMIREIDNDKDLSPKQKQTARNKLIAARNELVRGLEDAGFFSNDDRKLAELESLLD